MVFFPSGVAFLAVVLAYLVSLFFSSRKCGLMFALFHLSFDLVEMTPKPCDGVRTRDPHMLAVHCVVAPIYSVHCCETAHAA